MHTSKESNDARDAVRHSQIVIALRIFVSMYDWKKVRRSEPSCSLRFMFRNLIQTADHLCKTSNCSHLRRLLKRIYAKADKPANQVVIRLPGAFSQQGEQ